MPLTVDANAVAILSFEPTARTDAVAPPAARSQSPPPTTPPILTVVAAVAGADANGIANIQSRAGREH